MGGYIKDNGVRMNKMEMELRNGRIRLFIQEIMLVERNREKER